MLLDFGFGSELNTVSRCDTTKQQEVLSHQVTYISISVMQSQVQDESSLVQILQLYFNNHCLIQLFLVISNLFTLKEKECDTITAMISVCNFISSGFGTQLKLTDAMMRLSLTMTCLFQPPQTSAHPQLCQQSNHVSIY